MTKKTPRLGIIGECMLEFREHAPDMFHLDFSGDAYNVAYYYAMMAEGKLPVEFITAIGASDSYSERMLARWQKQGVGVSYVRRIDGAMPGLYMIETDDQGERSFYYYRREAAAKRMFDDADGDQLLQTLFDFDGLYFSGISLAILTNEGRDKFLSLLPQLKAKGVTLCFDNNYRARLWESPTSAKQVFNAVLPSVSIALPSFHDAQTLYGETHPQESITRYLNAGVERVIMTHGDEGYVIATADVVNSYPIKPVKVVDSTAAGDSFNAAYLARRHLGDDDEQACAKAATLSSRVVQHQGAIIEKVVLSSMH